MADPRSAAAPAPPAAPRLGERALHLFSLSSFAVAQPLFDILGRHPHFFVAHDSRPLDLIALVVVLVLVLPALLFAVELTAGLVAAQAGRSLHSVLVTFLAAATIIQPLRKIGQVPGLLWLVAALALGIATAALYDRFAAFRSYLTYLSPAPLVFAGIFLFFTPVEKLLFPEPYSLPVEVDVAADTPVVLVVFDELSLPTLMNESHDIDAVRFPRFAELARRAHWFRNATTTAEFTPIAIPAILTGRALGEDSPGSKMIATAERYPRNLFTLLAPEYRMNVFETMTNVCPRQLCAATRYDARPAERIGYLLADLAAVYPHRLLPLDLANKLPDISNQWRGFNNLWRTRREKVERLEGGREAQVFAEFLATLGSAEPRALYFIHSSLPHVPWRYLPSGKDYDPPGGGFAFNIGLSREAWDANDLSTLQGFQRYLLQLGFVDRLVGDLIDALKKSGLWDPALVIVTADHGVSFHSGVPRRKLTSENYLDVLPVPLFVKLPYQREGAVSDRNAELIDILPTILDVLGLPESPWRMEGTSLVDSVAPERAEKVVFVQPYGVDNAVTFQPEAFDANHEAIERLARLFGRGDHPLDLYRIGPHNELVGRPLTELEVAAEAQGELHLTRPELYDDVDLESGFLPARVIGEIRRHPHQRGALDLAISVNGTVWAVTRTFSNYRQRARFAAMVPESAFAAGRNTVELFVVSTEEGTPRLTPTRPAPRRSWIERTFERIREAYS